MPTDPPPARDRYQTITFWALVGVLVLVAFSMRMRFAEDVIRPAQSVAFGDVDTMRRLARIEALDAANTYPTAEIKDGFPDGTVSHWTLPFDLALRFVDVVAGPFVPRAEGFEAGAALAGPILGTLSVLLFLLVAVRLLGRFAGLAATSIYALQYPLLSMNAVGNGDHQNLQHLFLLGFSGLWLLQRAGGIGTPGAALSGALLGLGIWVSTESTTVFLAYVAITGITFLVRAPDANALRSELARVTGLLVALVLGVLCEQAEFFAFEWDKVSWFQLHPVLVFTAFLVLIRVLGANRFRVPIAALLALGAGVVVLRTVFGTAFDQQVSTFNTVNVWLQNDVSEFRSSFLVGDRFSIWEGTRRFTLLMLGLPVFLAAVCVAPLAAPVRIAIAAMTAATFGLAAWEVKLGHLFAMWFPLTLVAGGMLMRDRILPGKTHLPAGGVFVLVALVLCFVGAPAARPRSVQASEMATAELCDWLRQQPGNREGSVLAPWDLAGAIMYQADWPVVASGYHRNLAGIHDHYRFYLAQPGDGLLVNEILARRKVRYVVVWYNRHILFKAPVVLADEREFVATTAQGSRFTELAQGSMFWRLLHRRPVHGLRLCHQSDMLVRPSGGPQLPIFQVYEVTR